MNKAMIQCVNLKQYFSDADSTINIFDQLNLTVEHGQQIAITGASGSGKTTLLNLIGGLEPPKSGSIIIKDQDINQLSDNKLAKFRNHHIGFIYQFHHLLAEFTALENVAMPLLIQGSSVLQANLRAKEMLAKVGLEQRFSHKPATLSGGERQRTAIARALVTMPDCILADEPTGNLDYQTAQQIYELLMDLNQQFKITMILVTHDEQLADSMHRKYYLHNGQLQNMTA